MAAVEEAVKRLQIRKYPNRRYYDSTRSQHLTLEQIYSLIREGYEVVVTDSKTGQDITAKVLAQIIIDLDSPKLDVFPVMMLHRLLQSNTQIVGQFVERYFNQPLSALLNSPWGVGEYLRHAGHGGSSTTTDWAKLALAPFSPSFWAQPSREPQAQSRADSAGAAGVRDEIDSLRKQVSELQTRLNQVPASASRRRRK